jgi:hypothetical protein
LQCDNVKTNFAANRSCLWSKTVLGAAKEGTARAILPVLHAADKIGRAIENDVVRLSDP